MHAARALIRARYYSNKQWLVGWSHDDVITVLMEAEERFYAAVTGEADITEAARSLGCRMPDDPQPSQHGARSRSRVAVPVRRKPIGGALFE